MTNRGFIAERVATKQFIGNSSWIATVGFASLAMTNRKILQQRCEESTSVSMGDRAHGFFTAFRMTDEF
jgi:hypothetical protein